MYIIHIVWIPYLVSRRHVGRCKLDDVRRELLLNGLQGGECRVTAQMDDDQALRIRCDAQLTPSLCRRKQPFYFTTLKK